MCCSLRKIIVHLCREILNEERCPGFLLEAVRSAINKRRKLIKAKMLGIPVGECSSRSALHTLNTNLYIMSWYREVQGLLKNVFFLLLASDEEEKGPLFGQTEVDGTEVDGTDKPAESRIRNLWVQLGPSPFCYSCKPSASMQKPDDISAKVWASGLIRFLLCKNAG